MDKELKIALLIASMIKAGKDFDQQDIYTLYESGNVAEIGKRVYEALLLQGYCIKALSPAEIKEFETSINNNEK